MMYLRRFIFIFLVLLPSFTLAQSIPLDGELSISPEFPEPNTSVTVSLQSYSFSPDTSYISWKVNGKEARSGLGEKTYTTNVGNAGSQSLIEVEAKTFDGKVYKNKLTLTPTSITLMWEATDSYTPPFYKGKALPGEGASITFVALPSLYERGKLTDPKLLSYSWNYNNNLMKDASGLGKQSYTTQLNYLENENIAKVNVQNVTNTIQTEATQKISPTKIDPILYFFDPLNGANYAKALEDRIEIQKDSNFIFEPYYISSASLTSPDLSYSWLLNTIPTTPQGINTITIVPKKGTKGSGVLSISIENTKKYLQKAEKALTIVFDTTNQ